MLPICEMRCRVVYRVPGLPTSALFRLLRASEEVQRVCGSCGDDIFFRMPSHVENFTRVEIGRWKTENVAAGAAAAAVIIHSSARLVHRRTVSHLTAGIL